VGPLGAFGGYVLKVFPLQESIMPVMNERGLLFRWALLPGNARETWGRDLVADLPAVYPLGPQPHSEPGLAQDGRGRAMR